VKKAFEKFLNIEPNVISEYLAKFLDFHLKRTSKSTVGLNDEQLESKVKETIFLLKLVKAKDIFEEFYMRGLSRRLLLKKSASNEAEKIMVSRLRTECSNEFSTKTEAMLKDLSQSDVFMSEYKSMKGGEMEMLRKNQGVDASFHVLSSGSWPISAQIKDLKMPDLLHTVQKEFEMYYKVKHQGRCLTFAPSMSTSLVFANFVPKPNGNFTKQHQLEVSGLQAIVLVAFNTKEELTYLEL
jgi:hypothetical protein